MCWNQTNSNTLNCSLIFSTFWCILYWTLRYKLSVWFDDCIRSTNPFIFDISDFEVFWLWIGWLLISYHRLPYLFVTFNNLLHPTFVIMAPYHLNLLRLILLWKYKTPISFDWQVFSWHLLVSTIGKLWHWKYFVVQNFSDVRWWISWWFPPTWK